MSAESTLGGQTDRREFLSGVAALTAGAIVAAVAAAAHASARPRRIDLDRHDQRPGLSQCLAKCGISVSQYEGGPIARRPWPPALASEGLEKHGIDLAYASAATYYART